MLHLKIVNIRFKFTKIEKYDLKKVICKIYVWINNLPAVIKMLLLESNILSAKDSEEKPPNW